MTASILFLLPMPKIWSLYLTLLIISEICFLIDVALISFIFELYHFVHFIQWRLYARGKKNNLIKGRNDKKEGHRTGDEEGDEGVKK